MVQLIKMCHLIFLLFILIAWTLCEIVVIKKQIDKIYTGHVLFQVSMPTWSVCAQYCSRIKVCESINFIALNKTCQINDAEPGISDCELRESFGSSFVAASTFSQKLAGQCNDNDCELDQACMPKGMDYYCVPLPIHASDKILPRDCSDLPQGSQSGVYTIHPTNETFDVYCDMDTAGFGWTVFQSRINGTVDFYKEWCEYEVGFGNLKSEFWLGNKFINLLTSSGNYKLYIHLEDFDGNTRYAEYSEFIIGDASTHYTLTISGFSGNAGNSLLVPGFTINNMMFSTKDKDNDKHSISCAIKYQSGWWLNACSAANLNGAYLEVNDVVSPAGFGINWLTWRGNGYSLKATKMMIKRQ